MSRPILAILFVLAPFAASADLPPNRSPRPAMTEARLESPRLVGIILESRQALLWNPERTEYQLIRVGEQWTEGRLVEMAEDHVVMERDGVQLELALTPVPSIQRARTPRRAPAMIIAAAPVPAVAVPAAVPTVAAPAPAVAALAPVPVATVAVPAPVATVTVPAPVATVTVPAPVATVTVPAATSAPAIASSQLSILRGELDRELSDFDKLDQQVSIALRPEGGFWISSLRSGSFLERIGLRAGDVIVKVDGRPINNLEDASRAYAWLRVADRFNVELLRSGQPVTLSYVVSAARS